MNEALEQRRVLLRPRQGLATPGDQAEQEHRQRARRLQQDEDDPDRVELRQVLTDDGLPVALEGKLGRLRGGKNGRPIERYRIQRDEDAECAPDHCKDKDQPFRQAEEGPIAAVSEHQEDDAKHRVGGENIAMEKQDRMGKPDQPEAHLSAQEPGNEGLAGFFRRTHLQSEAVAEQEREEQVEFHFEEQGDHEMHAAIEDAAEGGVGNFQPVEGGGEGHDVDKEDAEQGKATQCIDVVDAVWGTHSCSPLREAL
ncbi:hypothetical protein ACU4I5_09030 [Ensifer adhaerens]